MKPITVLLADDHAIVRHGLRLLLEADGHFKIVGEARNGREAVAMTKALRPDVILMDIAMPVLNGLEATRQILDGNPAARVLMLSAHSDDAYIERMHAVGAKGFVEKATSAEFLSHAIRAVVKGQSFYSPAIARRMAHGRNWSRDGEGLLKPNSVRLTARETEVLKFVALGRTNRQVATTLGISISTVEKHRQRAVDEFNLHETADLTHYAIAQGLIERGVKVKIV